MTLLELQRQMADDVRRPLAPGYRMQRLLENGSSMEEHAASYIAPNPRLTSFERLEIYNRQYWFRIIDAVTIDFPALQAVLGEERFRALTLAYLQAHPSTSWTLRDVGAKLPEFLVDHAAYAGRRHALAIDVGRLEWAHVEAFDLARHEPLTLEQLAAIGPDSTLALQPHLQLLELSYPVEELVLAVHREAPVAEMSSNASQRHATQQAPALPPLRRKSTYLAVHRFDDMVYYRRLSRETYMLLQALQQNATLSEALAAAFTGSRTSAARQAAIVQESFALAAQLGWICAPGVAVLNLCAHPAAPRS